MHTLQPMNNAHEYTDAQLQAAIDAAFPAGARPEGFNLDNRPSSIDWKLEAPNRLAIARRLVEILAALPKPEAMAADEGAPATSDPYARLKAYAAAGAMIRAFDVTALKWGLWVNNFPWKWDLPPELYEVSPGCLGMCPEWQAKFTFEPEPAHWTLPTPPPGRRWHREDWKPEWLEGGYRPLLDGEVIEAGDEYCPCGFGPWKPAALDGWAYCVGVRVNSRAVRFRTRRPLPAEASAEPEQADASPPWIPHDGGPCPLKDEEVEEWEAKYSTGETVRFSHIKPRSGCCWTLKKGYAHYTHYRVLRWKPGHGPQAASKADFGEPWKLVGEYIFNKHSNFVGDKARIISCVNALAGVPDPAEFVRQAKPAHPTQSQQAWTPKPGDVVRLKSGGPSMTVRCLAPEGAAVCDWFNEGECEARVFPAASLTQAKEGQP